MQKHPFFIDKITNSIEMTATGQSFDTHISLILPFEIKTIFKKNGWLFNWRKEYKMIGHHIYKLTILGDSIIQGLLSLEKAENYIEMHLIETAPHNFGVLKLYRGVAGNMVAFACKMSFEAGFEGFVAFTAKTKLMQHYKESLGAEEIYRNRMAISGKAAKKLVNSYYKF